MCIRNELVYVMKNSVHIFVNEHIVAQHIMYMQAIAYSLCQFQKCISDSSHVPIDF